MIMTDYFTRFGFPVQSLSGNYMINLDKLVSGEHRKSLFWLLQCTGWLGVALLAMTFTAITYIAWEDAFWLTLFRTGFGFFATCILRLLYRRMRKKWHSNWLIGISAVLICGFVGALDVLLTLGLGHLLDIGMESSELRDFSELSTFLQASLLMRWVIYWFWSVLYFGINYWLDTQRVQLELVEAEAAAQASELKALRAQVNPHFLFNALGSILAESENPGKVRVLTLALSDYLRFSLQRHSELEPLETELRALENYLQVEQARFEENLEYKVNAEQAALKAPVPSALVQPLLENVIKYGQRTSARPLRLTISALVKNDCLFVTVTNSGKWVPPETHPSTKTGLANLRRRLQLIYGEDAGLEMTDGDNEVSAKVHLPVRVSASRVGGELEP